MADHRIGGPDRSVCPHLERLRKVVCAELVTLWGREAALAYFGLDDAVHVHDEIGPSIRAAPDSIDHRDLLTYHHSRRVAALSVALAQALDLSLSQIETIELGAIVHDIGKIGIPTDILQKPGPLTPSERAQMERHTLIGYDMLKHDNRFTSALAMVRWHHEAWNGNGYPDGLHGERLPLEARIVAIADAFEAMTADRPYRHALPLSEALERLRLAAGTQFDPDLVTAFCRLPDYGELLNRRLIADRAG